MGIILVWCWIVWLVLDCLVGVVCGGGRCKLIKSLRLYFLFYEKKKVKGSKVTI